jgi:hypothetical protein
MFKRISKPKFTADIRWRSQKGEDPRRYPWGVTVWLDLKAGDKLALDLFKFFVYWFEPAFAAVTTTSDAERKHFVKYPYYKNGKLIGTAEEYVGVDVGDTLPGIYWLTYLTPQVLDEQAIAKLNEHTVICRDDRGGVLIRAYENASEIGSEEACLKEKSIMSRLGTNRFFNIENWLPPKI